VDSSVWIDFFSSSPGRAGAELRRMIEEAEPLALTGIVVAEVLQGLTRNPSDKLLRIRARLQPCRKQVVKAWASAPERALAGAKAQVSNFAHSARLKSCPDTDLQQTYEMTCRDTRRIEQYLAQWEMLEPRGFETYREAAAIYRAARAKGITPTTIDAVIAAIALEHNAGVFTLDQDFSRIARITRLALYRF